MKLRFFKDSNGSALLFVLLIGFLVLIGSMTTVLSTKHTSDVTSERRKNVTAFNIAEAGSENALALLRSFKVFPQRDQTISLIPEQEFSGGRYSVECEANDIGNTVKLTSLGEYEGQSAKLQITCDVGDTCRLATFPPYTLWCIDDDKMPLYTNTYNHDEDKTVTAVTEKIEGLINPAGTGLVGTPGTEKQDMAISANGTIYVINAKQSLNDKTRLYTITHNQVDHDSTTGVTMNQVGIITHKIVGNFAQGFEDKASNIAFWEDSLYTINGSVLNLYKINYKDVYTNNTGSFIKITDTVNLSLQGVTLPDDTIGVKFDISAMRKGPDNVMYFIRNRAEYSELWKFIDFPNPEVAIACTIRSSEGNGEDVGALAAHPDGMLYAANEDRIYEINPAQNYACRSVYRFPRIGRRWDIKGMDFYYKGEANKLYNNLKPYDVVAWKEIR